MVLNLVQQDEMTNKECIMQKMHSFTHYIFLKYSFLHPTVAQLLCPYTLASDLQTEDGLMTKTTLELKVHD